jgi:hypothetical protein
MDKLAEEILKSNFKTGLLTFGNYSCVGISFEDAVKAMHLYHKAKTAKSEIIKERLKEQIVEILNKEGHDVKIATPNMTIYWDKEDVANAIVDFLFAIMDNEISKYKSIIDVMYEAYNTNTKI